MPAVKWRMQPRVAARACLKIHSRHLHAPLCGIFGPNSGYIVSHAVAELEKQAGTALFERLPRGVALMRCGASLLEESRSILTACRSLDRRIPHLEEDTPVNIVSSITIASFLLPEILKELHTSFPNIRVSVQVASANAAIDILRRGKADAGSIMRLPIAASRTGKRNPRYAGPYACTCNQKAEPVWESVNSLALIKAAEAGLGITILPEKLLSDSLLLKKLRYIHLEDMKMENQMLALFHRDKYITKPFQILIDRLNSTRELKNLK